MSERDKILQRIRASLRVPAPYPGKHGMAAPVWPIKPSRDTIQNWLPSGGDTFLEQVGCFQSRSADLKTNFQLAASQDEARRLLTRVADTESWKRVATHNGILTSAAVSWLGLPTLNTTGGYDPNQLEACDVGITECDALIAQTGSIILTSRDSGGRALSVLPPHHLVLARREQIVRDLSIGFERVQMKYEPKSPSMISIITGPSRTGDIERILVLGAHGPKKLTVICW